MRHFFKAISTQKFVSTITHASLHAFHALRVLLVWKWKYGNNLSKDICSKYMQLSNDCDHGNYKLITTK